jgi:hypothetical protein
MLPFALPQIEVRMEPLLVRQHEGPILGVVIRINDGKGETLKVCRVLAAGDVDELEIHGVRVNALAANQARPIASVAGKTERVCER